MAPHEAAVAIPVPRPVPSSSTSTSPAASPPWPIPSCHAASSPFRLLAHSEGQHFSAGPFGGKRITPPEPGSYDLMRDCILRCRQRQEAEEAAALRDDPTDTCPADTLMGRSARAAPPSSLLPGLPDDVALLCLARVPLGLLPGCRWVCRAWRNAVGGAELRQLRRQAGLREPWLFLRVLSGSQHRKGFEWLALDLATGWQAVRQPPSEQQNRAAGVGCAVVDGRLYCIGGLAREKREALGCVFRYDPASHCWAQVASLCTARAFFACWSALGKIFVAGGNTDQLDEVRSAEMYDPQADRWHPITPLGSEMRRFDAAEWRGRLYVTEGWQWPFHFSPRGFVLDPVAGVWEAMRLGMSEGWTGMSAVVHNTLFIVAQAEGGKHTVAYYCVDGDKWENAEGEGLPPALTPPFVVASHGPQLFVIGRGLVVAVATVHPVDAALGPSFRVEWSPARGGDLTKHFSPDVCQFLLV